MKKSVFLFALLMSLSLTVYGGAKLAAQTAPASGVTANMIVTVEARHGSNVPVINKEDVMVYEGRDRDKVTNWVAAQGDNAAMELFVLLDDSSGFSLGSQLNDLNKFINAQPPTTKVGVAYMQNGIAKVEQAPTTDHALAAKALRLPMGYPGANASPYFSLSDLIKRWPQSSARREVFMATDGVDYYYGGADLMDPYLSACIDAAQKAGILIYAVYLPGSGHMGHDYWRNYWGQLSLSRLADETGGESYYIGFTGAPVAFEPYLNDAANRFKNQYLLTFIPKPQKKEGLQSVKLKTEVPNAELVAAPKVFVAASE